MGLGVILLNSALFTSRLQKCVTMQTCLTQSKVLSGVLQPGSAPVPVQHVSSAYNGLQPVGS